MAWKKVCDICGEECSKYIRYELIEKGVFRDYKQDVCSECMSRIKSEIKDSKN